MDFPELTASYECIQKALKNVGQSVSDHTGTDGLNWFSVSLCGLSMLRQLIFPLLLIVTGLTRAYSSRNTSHVPPRPRIYSTTFPDLFLFLYQTSWNHHASMYLARSIASNQAYSQLLSRSRDTTFDPLPTSIVVADRSRAAVLRSQCCSYTAAGCEVGRHYRHCLPIR